MTSEQRKGTQFEIWLEHLFSDLGHKIERNVVFRKERYIYRQVDLVYTDWHPLNSRIIIEAKYAKYPLKLKLRRSKKKAGQTIDNIDTVISELEERRKFVKARKAFLVTNGSFEDAVYDSARKHRRIELYDHQDLQKLDRKRQSVLDLFRKKVLIDNQIRSIYLNDYNLSPGSRKL